MGPLGQKRNPELVAFLTSTGVYLVYWVYVTTREVAEHSRLTGMPTPARAALLSALPVVNLWVLCRLCTWVRAVEDQHGQMTTNFRLVIAFFLLPMLWPVAFWSLQSALNDHWKMHEEGRVHATSLSPETLQF